MSRKPRRNRPQLRIGSRPENRASHREEHELHLFTSQARVHHSARGTIARDDSFSLAVGPSMAVGSTGKKTKSEF